MACVEAYVLPVSKDRLDVCIDGKRMIWGGFRVVASA